MVKSKIYSETGWQGWLHIKNDLLWFDRIFWISLLFESKLQETEIDSNVKYSVKWQWSVGYIFEIAPTLAYVFVQTKVQLWLQNNS